MTWEKKDFLDNKRRLLLQYLLSPWRRRGASLLQVGLEAGLTPDFFWEAGFDVSALDARSELLEAARAATGPRVEYFLGQPDHLPFDDKSFDHVVLAHQGTANFSILEEAARVAAKGVIAVEWNRVSPARLGSGPHLWPGGLVFPWTLAWLGRRACSPEGVARLRSILPLPAPFWPGDKACRTRVQRIMRHAHTAILPVPMGGVLGMRMELSPLLPAPAGAVPIKRTAQRYTGAVAGRMGMPFSEPCAADGKKRHENLP
jgi:hypothetical protein